MPKSTIDEIRERFDHDVERFSNLETGQSATVDAPRGLDLVTRAALAVNPRPRRVLDLGCGAGNFTLRLLQQCDSVRQVTLVDLSRPMLDRAVERISEHGASGGRQSSDSSHLELRTFHGDLRAFSFQREKYDVILAGAVLHHLREETEWEVIFSRIFQATAPGGSFWIFDLVTQSHAGVQAMIQQEYGAYLTRLKDTAYRDHVFAYVEKEDSPRPLQFQLKLLSSAGYASVEVLHVNTGFAAFGGVKAPSE